MPEDAENLHWSDARVRWRVAQCLRSRCEPGWSIGERWSRVLVDLDLWVVLDGRGWMRAGAERVELRPGVAVLARPGVACTATQDPDRRLTVDAVHFDLLDAAGQRLAEAALPPARLAVPDVAAAGAITRRLRERYHQRGSDDAWRGDAVAAALLKGLLLDLEDTTRRAADTAGGVELHHRGLVARAEARLREDPANPPSVAELAAEACYSPDHFARVFRSVTGRTPQAAAIAARLDRARHLLRVTPMTVSQVADALGYSDVYFFSRQFKRFVGVSPTAFRHGVAE